MIILPVTARNILVAGDPVLISSSGGINFYIGNNPSADGLSSSLPAPYNNNWEIQDIKYLAQKETGRELNYSEMSDYYYDKGWKWIRENSGDFVRLYLKKIYYCIGDTEISNNRDLTLFFNDFALLKYNPLHFGLIFSLFAMAVTLLIYNRQSSIGIYLIIIFWIGYILEISMFFVNARFRLPILPILFILAGYAIISIWSLIISRKYIILLSGAVIPGILVYVLATANLYRLDENNVLSGYYKLGNYHLFLGQYDNARNYYRQIIDSGIKYPNACLNLGAAYLKQGQTDSAKIYFEKELTDYPDNAKAYANLASLASLQKNYEISISLAKKAIELKPYLPEPYIILIRACGWHGNSTELNNILQDARKYLQKQDELLYEASLVMAQQGDIDSSIALLATAYEEPEAAIETDDLALSYSFYKSKKSEIALQLGYLYGMKGNLTASIAMSRQAIDRDSSLEAAYVNLANAHRLNGETAQARTVLTKGLQKFPDSPVIRQFLNSL